MKISALACIVMFARILCACDHPAAPVAPETPQTVQVGEPPAEAVAATASADAPSAVPAPPRGKRAPCTTDQSCNGDPTVSALWGRCVKETGVCECNAGFELHPGGSCQPVSK